jgi:hypothetical protein
MVLAVVEFGDVHAIIVTLFSAVVWIVTAS